MDCALCGDCTDGRYLCERDTITLAKLLAELPVLYDEVAECLVPRRSSWGDIIPTRGTAGPRSPIDEDVLDTVNTGRAGEVVHLWRVDVQRERWPNHGAPPQAGLAADCRWLAMELEWIAANYPPVGVMVREIRTLEGQARSVVGDPPPRPKPIGLCIAVTDDQGTVCGATLTHTAGQSAIRCRQCRTVYRSETELLKLLHYQPVDA